MVNATVDNDPVSILLDPGQSTTVPSNETWKVQLTLVTEDGDGSNAGSIRINNISAVGAGTSADKQGQVAPNTVVTGGDTIKLSKALGASISGFVVDS